MLIMTLLVRDEEDILPWHLRYHFQRGVDHVIATDNLSEDGTAAILKSYEQQGRLTYLHEPDDRYRQDRWVTRMARMAFDMDPQACVLHCDADEFWWPRDATALPEAVSRELRRADLDCVSVPRSNFIGPNTGPDLKGPFFERMVFRQTESTNSLGRPLPGKVVHRAAGDLFIMQGNHALLRDGQRLPLQQAEQLEILHFPGRSLRQLKHKIRQGGAAYARNPDHDVGVGLTWRRMYTALQAGTFEQEFPGECWTQERVRRSLEQGSIMRDRRLQRFMHEQIVQRTIVP